MTNFTSIPYPVFSGLYDSWMQIKTHHGLDDRQVCLTNAPGHEDDPYYGNGSLYYDWAKATKDATGKMNVPVRDVPLQETDFTSISDIFVGTVFEELLSMVRKHRTVGRARFMTLKPHACLSWHRDTEPRLHLPLKTQDGCLMVIDQEVKHLPANTWWLTDTTKHHSVFNGSSEPRTHLVFCAIGGET